MEEARRHLADLEPKGAVEALLAVTEFAKSRGDDGNVETLLTSACHKLRDLVALRCLCRINPLDRAACLVMVENTFGTHRFDKETRAQLLLACKKMKEIEGDMFMSRNASRKARPRRDRNAKPRSKSAPPAVGARTQLWRAEPLWVPRPPWAPQQDDQVRSVSALA